MKLETPPTRIGTTELWTARLWLKPSFTIKQVQRAITEFFNKTSITVVGYYINKATTLTLLMWPQTWPHYRNPNPKERQQTLQTLAKQLQATSVKVDIVPREKIHIMMGRKENGYGSGRIAPIKLLQRPDLDNYTVSTAYMVSARAAANGTVEEYGEPVGIILAKPEHEDIVHALGDTLKQHHYAIERGPTGDSIGRTDFYETRWARQS